MVGRIAKVLLTTAVMALAVATEGSAASPIHFSVSGMIGGTSSEVAATGLMADYFAPTARTEATRSLRGGVECEALLWKWLGVSLGARYQQAGQHTRTTTVLYADDVFPHEFTSSIRMDYVAVPLCLKAGISAKRGWILARAGVSPAYLLHSKAAWTIDGVRVEPGTMRMPDVRRHSAAQQRGFRACPVRPWRAQHCVGAQRQGVQQECRILCGVSALLLRPRHDGPNGPASSRSWRLRRVLQRYFPSTMKALLISGSRNAHGQTASAADAFCGGALVSRRIHRACPASHHAHRALPAVRRRWVGRVPARRAVRH